MSKKENLSAKDLFKRKQKLGKRLEKLAPICFITFLILSGLSLILAFSSSFGNMSEIISLLDNKIYTGEQLSANYNYLIGKYGEWVIGSGGSGFTTTFVNIGRALFSGLMVASLVTSVVFFISAFVLGKWLLPKISKQILDENQETISLTVLEMAEKSK